MKVTSNVPSSADFSKTTHKRTVEENFSEETTVVSDKPIVILLIEDSPADAKLFEHTLQQAEDSDRYWLVHVKRLAKASKMIQRDHFDVVVLDLSLPDSYGIDSVNTIQEIAPDLPIVVMTGLADDVMTRDAIEAGAQDYLVKGTASPDQLSKAIRFAVDRQRRATEHELLTLLTESEENDPITQLPAPKLFHHQLEQAIAQAHHSSKGLAVLHLPIENLSDLGHEFGEDIENFTLRIVGQRIRDLIRQNDIPCRAGYDEFSIILQDLEKPLAAAIVAERLLEIVTLGIHSEKNFFSVKAKVGIALYPIDGTKADDLLENSRTAALQFNSPEPIRFYSEECNVRMRENKRCEKELIRAIDQNELSVYYQPQLDIGSSSLIGVHALLRWKHPEKGLLAAHDFIPQAERAKILARLNRFLLQNVCQQINEWKANGIKPVEVCLNLSGTELHEKGFAETVGAVLKETGVPPNLIAFQFRESAALRDWSVALKSLKSLKDFGVKLILDDFGASVASLSYFKLMHIDQVNISAHCVQKMILDQEEAATLDCLIQMSHRFHIKALAKGVESEEQLDRLRIAGCDFVQGYYLSEPLSKHEIEIHLAKNCIYNPLYFIN